MSDEILLMYVTAVETGRFPIEFVSIMYRQAVKDALLKKRSETK